MWGNEGEEVDLIDAGEALEIEFVVALESLDAQTDAREHQHGDDEVTGHLRGRKSAR